MLEKQKNIDSDFFKNTNIKEKNFIDYEKLTILILFFCFGIVLFVGASKTYFSVQNEIKKEQEKLLKSEHTNQAMIKNTYIENLTGLNEKIVIHEIDRVKNLFAKKINKNVDLIKIEDISFSNNEIKMTLSLTDNEKMVKLFYDKSSSGEENLVLIEGSNRVIPSKKLIIENQR